MSDQEANRDQPESLPAEHLEEGELDDDELDSVAGGCGPIKSGSKLQGRLSEAGRPHSGDCEDH